MKAVVSRSDLYKGLTQISRALSNRVQLPVLANVLVEAGKQGVSLSATNLEVGVRTLIGGKIANEGQITVPARSWTEFVANIPGQNINLEMDGLKLKVWSDKYQAVFSGIDANEFPALPKKEKADQVINAQLLSQIAVQAAYAAAVDESRPVLTGMKFSLTGSQLVVTATDGFRLARKVLSIGRLSLNSDLILPARTIQELARLAGENKEDQIKMELVEKNNQVIFSCGQTDLISRILEGNYPDTEKIIPTDFPIEALVDRQEFVRSLKAVSVFARDNNNIVKFKIEDSRFKIGSQASQSGESEIVMEAQTGGEGEIAFNYKYISDVLGSLSSERVKLQIKDSLSPGVFRPENDGSLLALVMPVRV